MIPYKPNHRRNYLSSETVDLFNRRAVEQLMRLPSVIAAECGRMGTGVWFFEVEHAPDAGNACGTTFRVERSTQRELRLELVKYLREGGK